MTNHYDVVTRWIDVALRRTTKSNFSHSGNVFGVGDTLYSYGTHFPMAEAHRDKRGNVTHFLLNGDRYSVTTNRHQSITRNAVARTDVPSIIVPFDALRAAGIDRSTLRIIDVTADRFERKNHVSATLPDGARSTVEDVWEYVELSADELAEIVDKRNTEKRETWERQHAYASDDPAGYWATWAAREENVSPPAPITVDDLPHWERQQYRKTGTRVAYYLGRGQRVPITREVSEVDGSVTWHWTTHRHWLGESVFRAAVVTGRGARARRWATFLSGFDMQERRPLYFLAELPRDAHPETVADAYRDLRPEVVQAADAMGRDVVRQGDIFAIPVPTVTLRDLRRQGATIEKGPRIAGDYYLPTGEINPDHVDRGQAWRQLLGQSHYATEVARMPDGRTLARGTMTHDPGFRGPDHARRKMGDGKTWHLIVKNTVPTSRRAR